MTNADNIRNMTNEELCDYIYSVFLTGKYYGQVEKPVEEAPDYMTWLTSEVEEVDLGVLEDSEIESIFALKEEYK